MCRKVVEQALEIRKDFRVELALRGEPTLNPYLLQNIRIIRKTAPLFQISMFTNGLRILKDPSLIGKILDSGVNFLCVECYDGRFDNVLATAKSSGENVVHFNEFSVYKKYRDGHKQRLVNLVPDIKEKEGGVAVRKIHNNGGNVKTSYLRTIPGYTVTNLPLEKRCARPFRELIVYHTGEVVICCHDWKATKVLGSVDKETLYAIWYGSRHLEVLKRLHDKDRSFAPCNRCDYGGGYRVGLLANPNKKAP